MSDTVTVSAHDLHRLLLQFRAEVERGAREPGTWQHAVDYDRSFERLADAIDARYAAMGQEPDPRTRCNHENLVYAWPDNSLPFAWVSIRNGSADGQTSGRLRHLVPHGDPAREWKALCGFRFVAEDVARRPSSPYPDCGVCLRERRLCGIPVQEEGLR